MDNSTSCGAGHRPEEPSLEDHIEILPLPATTSRLSPSICPLPAGKTSCLDGLRGVAALMVYFYHHLPWWYGLDSQLIHGYGFRNERAFAQLPFIRIFFTGGPACVATFFVLSGYVLSTGTLRTLLSHPEGRLVLLEDEEKLKDRAKLCRWNLLSATVRRPVRLYVPVLGVSVCLAIAMHLPFGLAPVTVLPPRQDSLILQLWDWFLGVLKLLDPFGNHRSGFPWFNYDPPAWTIPVEMRGSMMVFSILALATWIPQYMIHMFCFSGVFLLASYDWAMACFCGGMVLALNDIHRYDEIVIDRYLGSFHSFVNHIILLVGWYLLCQPNGQPGESYLSFETPGWKTLTSWIPTIYIADEFWRFYNSIGAFLLVYSALRVEWLKRIFESRIAQWLGKISFSLYLIHAPLEFTVGDRIYRILGKCDMLRITTMWDELFPVPDIGPLGLSSGFLIAQAVQLPLNIFLARLATKLLDKPSIDLGRKFVEWLGMGRR